MESDDDLLTQFNVLEVQRRHENQPSNLLASYKSRMGCSRTKEREREKDAHRGTRTTHLLLSGQMSLASWTRRDNLFSD